MSWNRLAGWAVRSFLILFVAVNAYGWLDILVLQHDEYERLIGSESACGISEAYCSWSAFIWHGAPFDAFAIVSTVALLWGGMPRREFVLRAIALAICVYLAWTMYDAFARYPRPVAAGMETTSGGNT